MRSRPFWAAVCGAAVVAGAAALAPRGSAAQTGARAGTLAYDTVLGPSLAGNALGDASARAVTVYLPPGYAAHPRRRYPAVYLLHGYGGDERGWTAGPGRGVAGALDSLAAADPRGAMIVVMPNAHTRLGGSMYANSAAGGRWEDYVAGDLVRWVDAHYRTLARRESRGVAGHSMGGYGALRLGMRRPDVFGAVYATSPCCISWGDLGGENRAWDTTLALGASGDTAAFARAGFYPHVYTALAAAWSPDLTRRPLPVAYPFRGRRPNGDAVADTAVYARWTAAMLVPEVPRYRGALRSLRGLAFDVGTREEYASIAGGTRRLDSALTRAGVPHAFEVFDGNHVDRVQQRLATRAFPFFAERLETGRAARLGAAGAAGLPIGVLAGGARAALVRTPGGGWGVGVEGDGAAAALTPQPVQIEYWTSGRAVRGAYEYQRVRREGRAAVGELQVGPGKAVPALGSPFRTVGFDVVDRWTVERGVLRLRRTLTVRGAAAGGFASGVVLRARGAHARDSLALFAPGVVYGGTAHLTDSAIGGARTYREGEGDLWVREDRLPAPLFGVRFADGSSLALLDPAPDGATTARDAEDARADSAQVDAGFHFASFGARVVPRGPDSGAVEVGAWYPGTEGEVTYAGDTYPGGQLHRWRRRYHPLADGYTQRYALDVRVGREADAPAFERAAWRWAWATLRPAVHPQDLRAARRALVDVLAERTERVGDRTGIGQWVPAVAGDTARGDRRANMGFTGRNLEAAEFLLSEGARDRAAGDAARGERLRLLGAAIFDSFARLGAAPPAGEGFDLDTGRPVTDLGWPADPRVYLRSLTDGFKVTVRAVLRERARPARTPADSALARRRERWLAWARGFGGWLLAQQRADGSLPRAWRPGTGAVFDASSLSSYAAVPFLTLLARATGEARYLDAARRAGAFAWRARPAGGAFVGGTVDNPDVIDKEAGTLSVEAYLALYEATRERAWLEHARAAADYAETWIYLWDVPMPAGAGALGWRPGVPTTGAQLIATGHSLVDEYMSFDVDEYARLARYTGDAHYLDVARLLLHDTKAMLALPGRTYDLKGPGWQQEHWSFAPRRGTGLHRGWLPWVATSQLNGMIGLEEFDRALYRRLAAPHR